MSNTEETIDQAMLAKYTFTVTGDSSTQDDINKIFQDLSITNFSLTESILSPTLQCSISVQSFRHPGYVKNLDLLAYADLKIDIQRDVLSLYDTESTFTADLKINSISNRIPVNYQVDRFDISATDNTMLLNADKLVSKSWHCVPPSQIVSDVLTNCIGAPRIQIENATPNRTYFAENIHPFQVISEQADVALANNNDPSFLHFMTFEDGGTHYFQSLQNMVKQPLTFAFYFREKMVDPNQQVQTYADPTNILNYEFPCDYDILLDLLNAVDTQGNDQTSLIVINPFNGIQSILGNQRLGCGQGGPVTKTSFTNKESAQSEGNCEIDVEAYALKRQARLNLLEPDKIPLRMTVPWNPKLHVGKMVFAKFPNKQGDTVEQDYGTGNYLIASMTHMIDRGGFATTTMDLVSESVGYGGSTIGK